MSSPPAADRGVIAELDRVLTRAEERLADRESAGTDAFMALYRRFWRWEEERLRRMSAGSRAGTEIARHRSGLMDLLMRHVSALVVRESADPAAERCCLAAMGGYGRGELSPNSDIDILFLHKDEQDRLPAESLARRALYLLWDMGLTVGHSCRSLPECLDAARADHRTATAMIESRRVWGDAALFDSFRAEFEQAMATDLRDAYLDARLREERERVQRYGRRVFLQEPNLKNGPGGLRDAQAIRWLAYAARGVRDPADLVRTGLLSEAAWGRMQRAYDFLLWVREALHEVTGRGVDVLSLRIQPRVAERLGYPGSHPTRRTERFMREYYLAARNLRLLYWNVLSRLDLDADEDSVFPARLRGASGPEMDRFDGFVVRGRILEADADDVFRSDPQRLLRLFLHARDRGLDPGPHVRTLARDNLALVDDRFRASPATVEATVSILEAPATAGPVLRMMHEVGLLGRLIPEFGALTCLVQHEFYHRYTADEHTLTAIENLGSIFNAADYPEIRYRPLLRDLEDPGRLSLALLLHDVGRGISRVDHAGEGARLAAALMDRLALRGSWTDDVGFLVRHHLLMSRVSQRRDLEDPGTIRAFADIVERVERLEMLALLTFADAIATGEVWSDWKDALLWDLYEKTRQWLTAGAPARVAVERLREERVAEAVLTADGRVAAPEIAAHLAQMPERYVRSATGPDLLDDLVAVRRFVDAEAEGGIAWFAWADRCQEGHSRVTVCARDRAGLFSMICGAFSLAGLHILSARISTRADGIAVDAFRVCDDRLSPVSDPRLRTQVEESLAAAVRDEIDLGDRLTSMRAARPPRDETISPPSTVSIDAETSDRAVIVEVEAPDRWGLLHDLSGAITGEGMSIELAKIYTERGMAIDVFYIVDAATGVPPRADSEGLARLSGRLRSVIR